MEYFLLDTQTASLFSFSGTVDSGRLPQLLQLPQGATQ